MIITWIKILMYFCPNASYSWTKVHVARVRFVSDGINDNSFGDEQVIYLWIRSLKYIFDYVTAKIRI